MGSTLNCGSLDESNEMNNIGDGSKNSENQNPNNDDNSNEKPLPRQLINDNNSNEEPLPKYLIIHSDVLNNVEELAEFRRKNFDVEQLKISDITANPNNSLIRDFLCDYSNANPSLRYILLIGDTNSIPSFTFNQDNVTIPTDFFYSNIKTNGQIPDLIVGRIPCNNAKDLETIIKKTKAFEQRKIKTPLLFGNGAEINHYGDVHRNFLNSEGYSPILLKDSGDVEVDLQNVVNNINQGVDLSIHYGHGDYFSMYPFAGIPVPELEGDPFILISGGCNVMDFANPDPSICMGYEFLKHTNGSVASIGASKLGGFGCDYSFIEGFFKGENREYELGELLMNGMNYQLDKAVKYGMDVGFAESFIKRLCLFGDPALKLVK
jgi:hypothetical protein